MSKQIPNQTQTQWIQTSASVTLVSDGAKNVTDAPPLGATLGGCSDCRLDFRRSLVGSAPSGWRECRYMPDLWCSDSTLDQITTLINRSNIWARTTRWQNAVCTRMYACAHKLDIKTTAVKMWKSPLVFIISPAGCWSTAPHAVVLTLMREHHYCVYLYMLCRLIYWHMPLIYTKQLPLVGSESMMFRCWCHPTYPLRVELNWKATRQ